MSFRIVSCNITFTAFWKTKKITKLKTTRKQKRSCINIITEEKFLSQDGIIFLAEEANSGFIVLSTIQAKKRIHFYWSLLNVLLCFLTLFKRSTRSITLIGYWKKLFLKLHYKWKIVCLAFSLHCLKDVLF